jgi:ABC-type transport system involved in multi-copper enzyme maturation permease subunit
MDAQLVLQKSIWRRLVNNFLGLFTQIIGNPVIPRELRVRIRLGRSYGLQAAYLFLLLLIVAVAYVITTGNSSSHNPYNAQSQMQGFYYTIFITLTSLIVLIAPALTAASITHERERKTIDLLLSTPLTSRELLTGKLVASSAFILLLLALSLPASAVCVLLGGASMGELLAAYAILAFDSILLCAFALIVSATSRRSGPATVGAYGLTLVILFATSILGSFALESVFSSGRMSGFSCTFPIGTLCPFLAPMLAASYVPLLGFKIPTWIVCGFYSLLLTRLLLTAAAPRVGLYDRDTLPSLRWQILIFTAIGVATSVGIFQSAGFISPGPGIGSSIRDAYIYSLMFITGLVLIFTPWISTYGELPTAKSALDGIFNPLRMFRRSAAGSLPFLFLWLGVAATVTLLVFCCPNKHVDQIGPSTFYFFSLVTLFWSIGRLASSATYQLVYARIYAILILFLVVFIPVMVAAQIQFAPGYPSNILPWPYLYWIFAPFAKSNSGLLLDNDFTKYGEIITVSSILCLLLSFLVAKRRDSKLRKLESQPIKPYVPAANRKVGD